MPRAIIFDLDGTLADSEPAHERAIRQVVEAEGMRVTPEQFVELCVGYGELPALRNIARANGRTLPEALLAELAARKQDVFEEDLKRTGVEAWPGAVDLVMKASEVGPAAVCSGSPRRTVVALLRAMGVMDVLGAVVSLDDVQRGKPDPEPYRLTAERLGCHPEDCVAIEDTPAGIASAVDAGLRVVAVGHSLDRSRLGRAHLYVDRIGQLDLDQLFML